MAEPIPIKRPLPTHETIPADVREKAGALHSRMERIRRVLTAASALPEVRRVAKDDLVALSKEALNLWSLV